MRLLFIVLMLCSLPVLSCNDDKSTNPTGTSSLTGHWWFMENDPTAETYVYYFADGRHLWMYAYDRGPNYGGFDCETFEWDRWEQVGTDKIVYYHEDGSVNDIEYFEIESLGSAGYRLLLYHGEEGFKGDLDDIFYPVSDISSRMRAACCDNHTCP